MKLFSSLFFLLVSLSTVFAQAPPLTSQVTGIVWQEDKPSNGVRGDAETPVPGILIKLIDAATDEVISSTLTEDNGEFTLLTNEGTYYIEYVFPTTGFGIAAKRASGTTDKNSAASILLTPSEDIEGNPINITTYISDDFTIGASATTNIYGLGLVPVDETITYCTQESSKVTVWNETLILPVSTNTTHPSKVTFWAAEAVYHPRIGIENTGTASPFTINGGGKVTMTMPIGTNNGIANVMLSSVILSGNLGTSDGVKDYGGTSGGSWYNRASYATAQRSNTNAGTITSVFVTPTSVSVPTTAESSVSITGSGNLEGLVETYVSAGACVVYQYPIGTLPVTLVSFTAKPEGNTANLNWATTSEANSERFDVERSADARNWVKIGSVKSHGESNETVNYTFADNLPTNGVNFYRLKMVDLDGTFAYSRINNVRFQGLPALLSVYPNPVVNELSVKSRSEQEIAAIEIFNKMGQIVLVTRKTTSPVNVSSLAQGIYSVRTVYTNGTSDKTKVLITH